MAFNKFLQVGTGTIDLTDGSQTIIAKTLAAINLDPSFALKTNSLVTIIS